MLNSLVKSDAWLVAGVWFHDGSPLHHDGSPLHHDGLHLLLQIFQNPDNQIRYR